LLRTVFRASSSALGRVARKTRDDGEIRIERRDERCTNRSATGTRGSNERRSPDWGEATAGQEGSVLATSLHLGSSRSPNGRRSQVKQMIRIREEASGDIAAIRRVNELAFRQSTEAGIVDALRANCDGNFSLVAVEDAEIIG
jgi:hypothetical protein